MPMFMTPETVLLIATVVVFGVWIYFGWVLPIQKIRDPATKTKTGYVMLLILLGLSPILIPLIMSLVGSRMNARNGAVSGTSMNGMGPAPVVNQGAVARMNGGPA